ncbi:UDP-N-acetyl-D-mannosaminuronic acid dehydrogenase [Alkalibacterium gilvum]|uniref:UDP-N-acetyl-D-mannosaminuronic acid dehydrogenase n=1 Tax=Alkalibacterium gilvum TaxID=1130080 RepID=A0A1H6TLN4_9LACT|nr:nucleotide sugar dehydrogenase [Alkalibacterium gilvum]SEI77150.1 UDP-N-acetyl-D-mannosaminuronic acid dehydrogenase [Alkalibacterium gilvum]
MENKVNVIGLGYIGLPTALMMAKNGVDIVGTDINEALISKLANNELTFEEKGLKELFKDAVDEGITFSTEYQKTDMYIVGVPTPYVSDNKKLDPTYVLTAVESILKNCMENTVIIIESTIAPGTIDKFVRPLIKEKGFTIGKDIHLVHAPERIIPGNMIYELEYNSRTIGADDVEVGQKVKDIYASFCKGEIVLTDIRSAEMSKVIENTFRDVNIAFANELAKICRSDDMDVYEIIRIANKHPRVNILQPGPGVGGHCISVDPWFLVGDYPDLTNLILSARKINDSMPEHVLKRLGDIMNEHNVKDLGRVGLYGLAYKENVDDTRESPTLQLLDKMQDNLAFGVKVYDPFIKEKMVENQVFDFDEFVDNTDIIVIMLAHDHLKENLGKITDKIILDTKNLLDPETSYKL